MLFLVSCSFPLTLYSFAFFCHRIGCIILSVGQDEFHDEMLHTMNFVVNQSDFTVQILRNVTGFLSLAKTINVDQVFLPSNDKDEIDKLNVDLNNVASTLTEKTNKNSSKIRTVLNDVYALKPSFSCYQFNTSYYLL